VKRTKERFLSPSVQVILEQLKQLGYTKAEFATRLGVSQDYVYRILNGRIAFPYARETIERIAEVCLVDPYIFSEYRELDANLSISTRLVWQRLRERNMGREDLYQAMGGRISRPYYNSILRGDQPFPTNRAYIQMFALALDLPPTAFIEFGPKQAPRWTEKDLREMEERTFQLFFDKMMADRGYAKLPLTLDILDEKKVLGFFVADKDVPVDMKEVLMRMGELNMGFRELEKMSGVPTERLRELFTAPGALKAAKAEIGQIRQSLHMDR
jgi:transcriptional regulator with XRE-family HTH domain